MTFKWQCEPELNCEDMITWVSSVGRASDAISGGRRFEPHTHLSVSLQFDSKSRQMPLLVLRLNIVWAVTHLDTSLIFIMEVHYGLNKNFGR